jgi:hypothetical protein
MNCERLAAIDGKRSIVLDEAKDTAPSPAGCAARGISCPTGVGAGQLPAQRLTYFCQPLFGEREMHLRQAGILGVVAGPQTAHDRPLPRHMAFCFSDVAFGSPQVIFKELAHQRKHADQCRLGPG